MHTWKIYDYSRTKTAAVLIYSFYFRSCATTSPMRIAIIHSVPPAFFYIFNSDILHISETLPKCTVIVTATRTKSNPVLVFFTLIFVNINETLDFYCSLRSRQHALRNITGKQ